MKGLVANLHLQALLDSLQAVSQGRHSMKLVMSVSGLPYSGTTGWKGTV